MVSRMRGLVIGLLLAVLAGTGAAAAVREPVLRHDAETRCLAWIAYAEAAGEGPSGLAAVIQVVRNRMADQRFPDTACAVARQPGQFQPVGERPRLRDALADPMAADLEGPLGGRVDREVLDQAFLLAMLSRRRSRLLDPTKGALYFVNPALMDVDKCPWFAGLKRTTAIGGHIFMTHYEDGEIRRGPALDCARAGQGVAVALAGPEPKPRRLDRSSRLAPRDITSLMRLHLVRGADGRLVARFTPAAPEPITTARPPTAAPSSAQRAAPVARTRVDTPGRSDYLPRTAKGT